MSAQKGKLYQLLVYLVLGAMIFLPSVNNQDTCHFVKLARLQI